jgi:hypothetical protein
MQASDFSAVRLRSCASVGAATQEKIMTTKSSLICATAIAIALTSFDLHPAVAAPQGGPAIAKQRVNADEISAARKRRRAYPGAPIAAFGAVMGVIGGIAAANARRDYYAPGYYGAPVYYDDAPAYGYYAPPAYPYSAPVYQHRDYYSRWGGSGGQPGYHGPNVNVPGPTNYGNAAGQNGQMPPLVTNPANP